VNERRKQVEIWPELPRSVIGKVLKIEVRSAADGGRDWVAEAAVAG